MTRRTGTALILVALTAVVGLVVIRSRPDEPAGAGSPASPRGPSFEVRVVKPLSARPLFGLLPTADPKFDHASPGARTGRVGRDRVELLADGWDLSIATDDDGAIAPGTRLVFSLELGGRHQTLRCLPEKPAVGDLRITTDAASGELGGSFRVELATCRNAANGKVVNWPPAPLTVVGTFDRLPLAPG